MVRSRLASGVEAADAGRRLGALGVQVMEDAERLAQRLRLSNAESERLLAFEYWWHVSPADGERAAHALLYGLGPAAFTDRVLVAWTRSRAGAADPAWHDFATLPQRWQAPRFSLRAADFIRRGVPKGPALGAAIRAAEQAWIEADFPPTPLQWRLSRSGRRMEPGTLRAVGKADQSGHSRCWPASPPSPLSAWDRP